MRGVERGGGGGRGGGRVEGAEGTLLRDFGAEVMQQKKEQKESEHLSDRLCCLSLFRLCACECALT